MLTWGETRPAFADMTNRGSAAPATTRVDGGTPTDARETLHLVPPTQWRVVEKWDEPTADSTSLRAVLDVVRAYRVRGHRVRLNLSHAMEGGRVVGLELAVDKEPSLAVAAAASEAERAAQAHATAEQWGGA